MTPSSGAFRSLKLNGAFDAATACWGRRRTPSTRLARGDRRFRGSPVDVSRREEAIETALAAKLEQRAKARELDAKAASKEIEEFTFEFKNAARECFQMIDTDGGGSLSTDEIVRAVKEDAKVIKFLKNCGEDNLQFLLHPPRLQKALAILDTDKSGEIDIDECTASRRPLIVPEI